MSRPVASWCGFSLDGLDEYSEPSPKRESGKWIVVRIIPSDDDDDETEMMTMIG